MITCYKCLHIHKIEDRKKGKDGRSHCPKCNKITFIR